MRRHRQCQRQIAARHRELDLRPELCTHAAAQLSVPAADGRFDIAKFVAKTKARCRISSVPPVRNLASHCKSLTTQYRPTECRCCGAMRYVPLPSDAIAVLRIGALSALAINLKTAIVGKTLTI